MIEDTALQYGAMGLFAAYLVYDRQVLLKGLEGALRENTAMLMSIREQFAKVKK